MTYEIKPKFSLELDKQPLRLPREVVDAFRNACLAAGVPFQSYDWQYELLHEENGDITMKGRVMGPVKPPDYFYFID